MTSAGARSNSSHSHAVSRRRLTIVSAENSPISSAWQTSMETVWLFACEEQ